MRKILAEIQTLRQLAVDSNNEHTTVLHDLIVPDLDAGDPFDQLFIVMNLEHTDLEKKFSDLSHEGEVI